MIDNIPQIWLDEIAKGSDFGLRVQRQIERETSGTISASQRHGRPRRYVRPALKDTKAKGCCGGLLAKAVDRVTQLASSAVDFVRDGMTVASEDQQASRLTICAACPVYKDGWCDADKGGCGCNLSLKVKARAAFCPQGKWFPGSDNHRPLLNPVRHLMFHVYPLKGKEWNWHWHIAQIRKHQAAFTGRIVIGVSVDSHTASMAEVQHLFEGIRVDTWLLAHNNKLAETNTHVEMLAELLTDDPHAVIFRYHTKGVTHQRDGVEQKWAEIMWTGNMDLASVDEALASHLVCGVMRSQTPLVKKKPGDFFYAGSAYWMRAKEVFERDWRHTDKTRWWVEYVPCHLFAFAESACLFHDLTPSSVLNHDYFAKHVEPEWTNWKAARGIA
jgi:hypothetical protein